jgi:tape measure domain-containing protein
MVDIASLAIQIDTSDVARAESDLAKLNGAGTKAEKAAKGVEGSFTGAARAAGIYRDAAGRLREANGKFVTEARKVELGLKGIGDQAKKAGAEFNGLSNVAGKVGASIVAALSVREVYQATEAYTSISNRLRLVTDSAGAFAAAQAAVFRVAQEGRQPLTETAELYQRIATNQQQLGLTGEGVARVTETISKSLAVSGASAATAAGALTQLGQAFASGTLRGEELNSVLEGAPALAQTLARGLNVTVGELRALGAEGKLTAEQVVGAILSQSDAMDEAFGKLAPNISGALTTVGNSFTQLIGKMDETSGASSDTASAIMEVADILSDPATVEAAQIMGTGVAKGIGFIAEAATTTVGVVKWMAEELAATFNGIASDDRVRLEDELARLQEMRESGPLDRLVFFGTKGAVNYATDAEIDAEIAKIQQALKAYDELGAAAGRTGDASAASTPKIEAFRTGTASLGTAAAEAAGKTDKQAVAFQSLMDGLFPAEAAQRKYNEQVALLDKYLDGDQLAKAIDRLNHSIAGADATGPGDVIEEYRKELQRLEDQLDPVGKATKQYQQDVKRLDDALGRGELTIERHGELMAELGRQYDENRGVTSEWAKWTESSLERVDAAFADAWRNIGDGFSSFRDSLTNAFKQMLAELAHLAITRPIVMQIGAAIGIGGGAGQVSSMLGSGSAGGLGFGDISNAFSLYQASQGQGFLGSVWSGYQSGGLSGAWSGVTGYGSGLLSGIDASAGQLYGTLTNGASATYAPLSYQAQVGGWSEITQGAAPWLSGLGGAYMGYQNAGAKGAVAGGLGGWGGAKAGAAMGSYFGPIGTAVGAVLGGILGSSLGSSIFGGDWQTKDVGLALSVNDGEFLGQQFEYQKKKGGLFSSDKKRTRYSALDAETAAALQQAFDATEAGVAGLFEALSYSIEDGSLDGLQLAREKISTKGKTEEEISEAINEWFANTADAMTAELNKVFATGLDLDLEGMQAFVGNLQGVNEVLRYLDVEMYDASVAGGKLAEALSAAAGGLDALATNSQTYYSAFFSEAEKVEDTIDSIKRAFEAADVELVGSREAYRAMVEDIDLTTEAGQEMFATLMALSGQAAQYYDIVEQQAAQANAALIGTVNSAYASLQRSIAAQQRELQQEASSTAANINALTGVSNSLDAALKRLRGSSDDAVRMLRAQAVMTLNSALVTARAGGSLADYAGLQDALDVASNMDTSLYRSLEDFEREQGRTANLIAELEKVNGKQLSTEQRMLEQYEKQMQRLDAQLAFAQAQLDALNGVDNSVLSVVDAINAMNSSVVAALSLMGGKAGQNATPTNVGTLVESVYRSVLGRDADAGGLAYWKNDVASGNIRLDQLEEAIRNAARANGEIPAFASGGLHAGGLRLVGEKGPELEVTGPSRIYNASQTAAMLSGAGSTEELRALRSEVAGLRSALGAIAKYTESTAYGVRQINEIGIPQSEVA